jgi:quinol monooxygenase YgiN
MITILPTTNLISQTTSHRFRILLSPIATHTLAHEPNCLVYAWFVSDVDQHPSVPQHFMQGLEIYRSPPALAVDHRAGEAYKVMRAAVGAEKLTERASDLRALRRVGSSEGGGEGCGWITRSRETFVFGGAGLEAAEVEGGLSGMWEKEEVERAAERCQYLVVRRFQSKDGNREDLVRALRAIESVIEEDWQTVDGKDQPAGDAIAVETEVTLPPGVSKDVHTFLILEYPEEMTDEQLVTVERYTNKLAYERIERSLQPLWNRVAALCQDVVTTRWVSAGIGLVRGLDT